MRDALIVGKQEQENVHEIAKMIIVGLEIASDDWSVQATSLTAALTIHAASSAPDHDSDSMMALHTAIIQLVESWIVANGGTSATNQN
jgi:hypothetical protein